MSVFIRYLINNTVKEDFLGLIPPEGSDGVNLAKTYMKLIVDEWKINKDVIYFNANDGAPNILGEYKGAIKILQNELKLMKSKHCTAHRMNLVVSHTSIDSDLASLFEVIIHNILNDFTRSPDRIKDLEKFMKNIESI